MKGKPRRRHPLAETNPPAAVFMTKPIERRTPTQLEQQAIAELQHCSLPSATSQKRFILGFICPVQQISDKEANYALFLCYKFRRQISRDLMTNVWNEWQTRPDRLRGFKSTGELKRFMSYHGIS